MIKTQRGGSWGVRILIRFLTIVFGVLVFWLLGFLVRDIKSIPGSDYRAIEENHLDRQLVKESAETAAKIADLDRLIKNQREEQRLVGDSSQNLQRTINQLVELQKLNLQQQTRPSEAERSDLSESLKLFLASQQRYEELNASIATLTSQQSRLEDEKQRIDRQLEHQREAARKEFARLSELHRLKLAGYQLAVLVPLLLAGGYFLLKRRETMYAPLFLAFGVVTLVKVGLVMHEYFPSRYFKYILTLMLIVVVARVLVHFIRAVAFPKAESLLRQYREAYERFLCPVCEYPIRTGPRKFLYWTRRTVHKVLPGDGTACEREAHTCPSCGTTLFEVCSECGKIRHSLLPHCEHCGAKKDAV